MPYVLGAAIGAAVTLWATDRMQNVALAAGAVGAGYLLWKYAK